MKIAKNVLNVILVVALAGACSPTETESGQKSKPRSSPGDPASLSLEDELQAELTIDDQPDWMTSGFGSIWVLRDEAGAVDRIDPKTNEVRSTIKIGEHPCDGIVAAFGSVWAPSCTDQALYRISPRTEKVEAVIDVPIFKSLSGAGPFGGVDGGEGAMWLVTDGGKGVFNALARIDPESNSVTETIPLGHVGGGVASGGGAIWVTAPDDGLLLRVDPATGKVEAEVKGLSQPSWLAVGEGGVWVLSSIWSDHPDGDGSVVRIDPETNEVIARIEVDERPGQAAEVTLGNGFVWARTQYTLLAQIDPSTNSIVSRYTDQKGIGGVEVAFGSVWLSDFAFNRVWRVPAP